MGHGTYAKLFEDVWYHRKTIALARAFSDELKVPSRWARQEVVHQLHLLLCWCLRESDQGQVGHLNEDMFARVVDWDQPSSRAKLLELWRSSGFLDVLGPDDVRIHSWDMNMTEALRKRRQRVRTASGHCPDSVRDDESGQRPDNVATSRARSEDGSGRRKTEEEGVRERPPSAPELASPPDGGEAPPATASPRPNPNPSLRAFAEARQARYGQPEAWPNPGKAAKEAATVQEAKGLRVSRPDDLDRWRRACERFFADDSLKLRERRHPWGWFVSGISQYLDEASPPRESETPNSIDDPEVRKRMELQFAANGYDPKKARAEAEANAFRSRIHRKAEP